MVRQGKYTRRVSPLKRAKWHARKAKGRFQWFRRLSWKKKILIIGTPILIVLVIIPLATYFYFARDIADQDRLMNRNNTGLVIYDNSGKNILYSTGEAQHHDLVPLTSISPNMQHAIVASEDKDFYNHSGFSIFSTLRAVYSYAITGGKTYGGSTITQQLAKITVLSNNRSFLRQYQAFSIAVAIENTYTKDQILDMYLNSAYFGQNAFGVQDAARDYFGTTPDKLTLAQSAMLVGLLPAPNTYSPVTGNATYAKESQTSVLNRMVTNNYISKDQEQSALAEVLTYQAPQSPINDSAAPHFAQMVLQQLYDKYGEETVTRSGYRVKTTLDLTLQNQLQTNISNHIAYIQRNGGSNAGGVAIDPSDGEIRAMVGSANWNDPTWGKVNMATTARQPGSSFKPIYYSDALATGVITPATIFVDEPTNFGGYKPQNASRTYSGNITVRNALSRSLNIPSVKVMQKLGISEAVSATQRVGITTLNPNANYGLSLALGSAEVPLDQMTNAYAAFANQGQQYPITAIKEIDSKFNEKVFVAKETPKSVISQQGAFLISSILSDNAARAPIFGSSLSVPGKTVAVKTGTTDNSRDAWTIGYTPQMAIGVWVGNNDNTTMRSGGSDMAGPIWLATMKNALATTPNTPLTVPSGVVQRYVCSADGSLADGPGAGIYSEYFLSTALPTATCSAKPVEQPAQTQPTNTQNNSPTVTDLSLSVSPTSTATFGSTVTLSADISPSATGTVTFMDGQVKIGSANLSNGEASMSTSTLAPGSHVLSAVFTPTDPEKYKTSTSQSVSYTITIGQGNGNGGLFH